MRHACFALALALSLAVGWQVARAQTPTTLTWTFDAGLASDGWQWSAGAVPGTAAAGRSGAAGTLTASEAGQLRTEVTWHRSPATSSGEYHATLWLRRGGGVGEVVVRLSSIAPSGEETARDERLLAAGAGEYLELSLGPIAGGTATARVRIVITVEAEAAGATLAIDDVTLTEVAAPATATATASATATQTATATSTPTATATASATATQTATATTTASPTATSTATTTPAAAAVPTPAVFGVITNGEFEDARPLYGWSRQGGEAVAGNGYVSDSTLALLVSNTSSTKWLHQAVLVTPDGWYTAAARLGTLSPLDEAWLRLAWYASIDGSGSQLGAIDSAVAAYDPQRGSIASLGPVRAPPEARSVRVRLMLRPASSALAMLLADHVAFSRVAAPTPSPTASPTPTPTPSPTPTPTPTSTPRRLFVAPSPTPVVARPPAAPVLAGPPPASGPVASPAPTPAREVRDAPAEGRVPAAGGSELLLRISELLPDSLEPGPDRASEWVEIANLGSGATSLLGLTLEDNVGGLALPAIVLPPGGVLVLGGPEASTGAAVLVQLIAGGISNGLGNGGDRLALLDADGRLIDALSYGSDATYAEGQPRLPAPGAGRSLRRVFADDGSLIGVEVSDTPSPGAIEAIALQPVRPDAASVAETEAAGPVLAARSDPPSSRADPELLWMLGGVAGAALLAGGARRAWLIWRER